jgi:hypothetical protein
MMSEQADILFRCPHCGGTLVVAPCCTAAADGRSTLVSTVRTNKELTAPEGRGTSTARAHAWTSAAELTQAILPTLPERATTTAKASLWKRALAIAHRAIDEHPEDDASQIEAFKEHCCEQGLPYGARGGAAGRPLYARALDFAREQRRRRGAR